MNILEAIKEHPNLMNNYRRAALCLVLAHDMEQRGEFNERRDKYLLRAGMYLGTAQGWLFKRYNKVIDGSTYTCNLAKTMLNYGGTVANTDFIP